MLQVFYLALSQEISYSSVQSFKDSILALPESSIKDLLDIREETEEYWSYTHQEKTPIKIVWTGIGACRYQTTLSGSACQYYFNSNHPNNRRPDIYGDIYSGYTKNPSHDGSTGCMQVDGVRGGCFHNR